MKLLSIRPLTLLLVVVALVACSGNGASSEDATWEHLSSSIEHKNRATQLGNEGPSPAVANPETMDEMKRQWQLALEEARQVDASILNEDEPGFGDRYKNEFQKGLELVVGAKSNQELIQGQRLLRQFGEYFQGLLARKRSK